MKNFHKNFSTDRFFHDEHFYTVSELAEVNGFWDYMWKSSVRPLFYIFSKGSHVSQQIKNQNIDFVQNNLGNNHQIFILIHSVVSEEKTFFKMLTTTEAVYGLWPGELTRSANVNLHIILKICVLMKWCIKAALDNSQL